jgi:hypothetical protein
LLLATAAAASSAEFQVREIKVGDQTITVVIFRGQSYRKIVPGDLTDTRLANQLICLEGKVKTLGGGTVRLYGGEEEYKLSSPDLVKGYAPGDNIWLGGRAKGSGTRLEFEVTLAVKLKSDLELFEERYKEAAEKGDWKQLLELAAWIDKSKDYNTQIDFEEHRRYRNCHARAVSKACECARASFKESNAEGYVELAVRLLKLGADAQLAHQYLQIAAGINPELQQAARMLSEAGFHRHRGRWVTAADKKRLEAVEEDRERARLASRKARRDRRMQDAVGGVANYSRDVMEMESAVAGLKGAEYAARLASEVERAADVRLARRALFLAAALEPRGQAAPIAAAMRSAEPQVRVAALELVATRKDLAARKVIAEAARSDSSEEVAELACKLLAAAADVPALEALIGLVEDEKEFRARAAVEALRAGTREDLYTLAEWQGWWKKHKASFPAGPTE